MIKCLSLIVRLLEPEGRGGARKMSQVVWKIKWVSNYIRMTAKRDSRSPS